MNLRLALAAPIMIVAMVAMSLTATAPAGAASPTMTLDSRSVAAGGSLTITGSHFGAHERGSFRFSGDPAHSWSAYRTTSGGSFQVTVRVPFTAKTGSRKVAAIRASDRRIRAIQRVTVLGYGTDPTPPSPPVTYDAVFTGDATGVTDVTSTLRAFLESHDGQRVALAENGTYRIGQMSFTARDLTVDFRGAHIVGDQEGARGIIRIQDSTGVTLNDARVTGTNASYAWVARDQWEHGISVNGGSDITLHHPVTRHTRGDGIYVGTGIDSSTPTGVVIIDPDIAYAGRNGIAPVAGEVTITGGRITHVGLHGIDFEANDATEARSIIGVVDGIDIRHYGELPIAVRNYAVAASGSKAGMKQSLVVRYITGDSLRMTIRNTRVVSVRNNVSETRATIDFPRSSSVTFSGNTRLTRV